MPGKTRFSDFDEFFAFYVRQHCDATNRRLHLLGLCAGIATVVGAIWIGRPWFALLGIPVAYSFAWSGHFFVERNRPATFGHPLWSIAGDFRMLGLELVGRLKPWLEIPDSNPPL